MASDKAFISGTLAYSTIPSNNLLDSAARAGNPPPCSHMETSMEPIEPACVAIDILVTEVRRAHPLIRSTFRSSSSALVSGAVEHIVPTKAVGQAVADVGRALDTFAGVLDLGNDVEPAVLETGRTKCFEAVARFRQSLVGCAATAQARAIGLA